MSKYKKFTDEEKQDAVMRICDDIATGSPLTQTLQSYGVVSISTFNYWLNQNPELKLLYHDAQKHREQHLFDEMLRIAYSESPKEIKKYRNGELYETIVKDSVEDRRIKINTIKWALGKMNPNKYGEKVIVDDATSSPITAIRFIDVNAADD
ncbi:MAG: transposase [Flavobacterium nitrogenifigens]|uniref:Uncharacterized protein n=2 Tax=Flavobacterium nitrogenifigens TaxID=1617283 RepID=A0A521ADY1_9FLAO|nr:hypothetical protein [Flavobacterium nitrogenifigens]MDQ8014748.1 transposase [Flavobacterium nitrogenifigens]SMO33025.1 hypothetical protein SAMN06265220_10149 [Flavobacterium nitrogenifigens]